MAKAPDKLLNIHTMRTLIVNGVTAAVAAGLWANARKNRDVPLRKWPPGEPAPLVEIIIPVRNEESNILPLLRTLIAQDYPPGMWGITVVDDGSTDTTRRLALSIASQNDRVRVVRAAPLPPGWTGKNHAMHTGCAQSQPDTEWLLFVDADTRHHPLALSSAVLRAREAGADMLSLVIDVKMHTFWERLLVPQVGELYTLLVGSMDSVNSRNGGAAANGQFMLVRRELYARAAQLEEVRTDVAEDRALAACLKAWGHNVRLEYGRDLASARVYSSLGDMWSGYSKTIFWASGHKLFRSMLVAAALALYALTPPLSLLYALLNRGYKQRSDALMNAPLQLLPMLALRAAVCGRVGVSPLYALAYPLAVLLGDAMLLYSAYRVLSGKGVQWKGRTYQRR